MFFISAYPTLFCRWNVESGKHTVVYYG